MATRFLTVSFSGAGHLLPYHLGVASKLVEFLGSKIPVIRAVSGSSSGAIAACVMSLVPHQIDEFATMFLSERGRGLSNLQQMLRDSSKDKTRALKLSSDLYVCTTKCDDGSPHLFHFHEEKDRVVDYHRILQAIQASCTIPQTFHPIDLFSSGSLWYPESDGIKIDEDYHVDGGIGAPAPPTGMDDDPDAYRIVVSPVSGGISGERCFRISPRDSTFSIFWRDFNTRGGFAVRPSIQNLRAMVASGGMISPLLLEDWHERGKEDALRFIDEWSNSDKA